MSVSTMHHLQTAVPLGPLARDSRTSSFLHLAHACWAHAGYGAYNIQRSILSGMRIGAKGSRTMQVRVLKVVCG